MGNGIRANKGAPGIRSRRAGLGMRSPRNMPPSGRLNRRPRMRPATNQAIAQAVQK